VRFLLLLPGFLAPLGLLAAEIEPRLLMDDPVRVTVTVEPAGDGESAVFHVGESQVATLYTGDADQDFRSNIIWQAPYLLIRSVSGGNCWDCAGEAVFRIEGGKALRLGDINTDLPPDNELSVASGYFVTTYSRLELQAGFCHACSPSFVVSLADRGDRLEIDGDGTWALNEALWQREMLSPAVVPAEGDEEARFRWEGEGFRDLVAAAALARFCGHEADLAALRARWEPLLDEDGRKRLAEALDLVKPLEPVSAWNSAAPY